MSETKKQINKRHNLHKIEKEWGGDKQTNGQTNKQKSPVFYRSLRTQVFVLLGAAALKKAVGRSYSKVLETNNAE